MSEDLDDHSEWRGPLGRFHFAFREFASSAVAVRAKRSPGFRGSGFLVAPHIVATAKHVVVRAGLAGPAPRDLAPGEAASPSDLFVSDETGTAATCRGLVLDGRSDLALLFLSEPLDVPSLPLGSAASLAGETISVSAYVERSGEVETYSVRVPLGQPEVVGGRPDEALVGSATPPGTSGGALVHGIGPSRRIVALVSLGNEAAARGRVVLSDRILEFMAEHDVPSPPIPAGANGIEAALACEGLVREVRLPLDARTSHRMVTIPAGTWFDRDLGRIVLDHPIAVSVAPVSEREWAALRGAAGGDRSRPCRGVALADVEGRLAEFSTRTGFPVAVVDADVLKVAWRIGGGRPTAAHGEAVGYGAHVFCRLGIALPPIGAREWTRTRRASGDVVILSPATKGDHWDVESGGARPTSSRVPFGVRLMIDDRAALLRLSRNVAEGEAP